MGGGPCHQNPIRTTCLITFPEESKVEPASMDAVFVRAIGIRIIKRIGREKLGTSRPFGAIHKRPSGSYVAVCKDEDLRRELSNALRCTPQQPILPIHLIFLENMGSTIQVRPVLNAIYSPEPVTVTRLPRACDDQENSASKSAREFLQLSSSEHCSRPSSIENTGQSEFVFPTLAVPDSLATSVVFSRPSSVSAKCGPDHVDENQNLEEKVNDDQSLESRANTVRKKDLDVDQSHNSAPTHLPLATVVPHSKHMDHDIPTAVATTTTPPLREHPCSEEFVILHAPTGSSTQAPVAESVSQPARAGTSNNMSSTGSFYISTSWHLQADQMSASLTASQSRIHEQPVRNLQETIITSSSSMHECSVTHYDLDQVPMSSDSFVVVNNSSDVTTSSSENENSLEDIV